MSDEIDTMAAGRELDVLILCEVFGVRDDRQLVPRFSAAPAAALTLLERFWSVVVDYCAGASPEYTVTITARGVQRQHQASGETFQVAMCRAALKAKRGATLSARHALHAPERGAAHRSA